MALAWIDEYGIHLPDYPAVLADVQEKLRAVYGEDLYLEPDSQDGQMVAIFAQAIHDAYALAGSVYNSFSPATAQGAGLSRMVAINGLRRQTAGHSVVDVTLVGQPGTTILDGQVKDDADQVWLLPESVVIPAEGQANVTATAREEGDIRAAAGEVHVINTPTRGWQSVNNSLAATPGAAVETDADLRIRQAVSTALPSRTVFEGTVGAVAAVAGVTRYRGYENDTGETDADGIPPHSISLVVEGGDAEAVARAVAIKKTPGCGTYGTTRVAVRDSYGVPLDVCFFRPTAVPVYATVTLRPLPGYLAATGENVRAAVAEHINGLGIGEDVLLSRLFCPINGADAAGSRTFDIVAVTLGTAEDAQAAANIGIAFNAVAGADIENITLVVLQA